MNKRIINFALIALGCMMPPSCGERYMMDEVIADLNKGSGSGNEPAPTSASYVDLGLSVKWAVCDLDASSKTGFASSEFVTGSHFKMSYKTISDLPNSIAGTSFDNATAILGEGWATPTKEQVDELYYKCTVTYGIRGEGIGIIITGPNGKSIFMTANQDRWTSSRYLSTYNNMRSYRIGSDAKLSYDWEYNYYTYPIRPVYTK